MSEDFSNPESEQGAFNAAIEYLKTLTAIERQIDMAFLRQDYTELNQLLDVLWAELSEWMKPQDQKKPNRTIQYHDNLRTLQKKAYQQIMEDKRKNKHTLKTTDLEAHWNRYKALKKLIHDSGMRMPKMSDPAFAMGGKHY